MATGALMVVHAPDVSRRVPWAASGEVVLKDDDHSDGWEDMERRRGDEDGEVEAGVASYSHRGWTTRVVWVDTSHRGGNRAADVTGIDISVMSVEVLCLVEVAE